MVGKGPVEPEAAQKGEGRVWGYNFGMRDSPIAREAAFEPEFERRSKAEAEPEGHVGRWKQDERMKASKRTEKKRAKAEEKQKKKIIIYRNRTLMILVPCQPLSNQ
jgi:hypothetical protein